MSKVSRSMRFFGGYARMLDLGGAPSSMNDASKTKNLNRNKNCHLQVVIFDFDLLCRSVHQQSKRSNAHDSMANSVLRHPEVKLAPVQPDVSKINQLASLLKVNLGGNKENMEPEDDLSQLTGEANSNSRKSGQLEQQQHDIDPQLPKPSSPFSNDIRHKYAAKLQKRTGGSTVTSSSLQSSDGDASFHLEARRAVLDTAPASNSTRWMAGTGTGQLLQYLHARSLQMVLFPTPGNESLQRQRKEMNDFVSQMKDKVAFTHVFHSDENGTVWTADQMVEWATKEYGSQLGRCLWVSDRDDVLREARGAGILTLRVCPPNARRGNVSAHYTVESVPETADIVNDVNGISFSTVISSGRGSKW